MSVHTSGSGVVLVSSCVLDNRSLTSRASEEVDHADAEWRMMSSEGSLTLSLWWAYRVGSRIHRLGSDRTSASNTYTYIQCYRAKTSQNANGHFEGPIDFFDQSF